MVKEKEMVEFTANDARNLMAHSTEELVSEIIVKIKSEAMNNKGSMQLNEVPHPLVVQNLKKKGFIVVDHIGDTKLYNKGVRAAIIWKLNS